MLVCGSLVTAKLLSGFNRVRHSMTSRRSSIKKVADLTAQSFAKMAADEA